MVPSEIIVTNIKNEDTINYSVVLIKGKIIFHECSNEKNWELELVLNGHKHMNYRFKDKQFKILVELVPGGNTVTIKCCCTSKNLNINFSGRNSVHKIIPLYIINKNYNGKFQAPCNIDNTPSSACDRIQTITKLLQCIISEKLHEDGFGRKAFEVEDCQIFYSNLDVIEINKMTQRELWEYLGREIMNSKIGDAKHKYLGFLSWTKYMGNKNITKYEDMVNLTQGYVALGGGGLALFGTASMYTWPESILEVFECFENSTIVDSDNFLNDSCYRNTLGACFSTTLGSVLHELCHTFDLGHTTGGIMGRGFDNIHKFFIDVSVDVTLSKKYFNENYSENTTGFVRNPKNFKSINSYYKNNDDTYFARSCTALLYYHRFFNNYSKLPDNFILTLERKTRFIRSTTGIRIIEVRENITELVLNSWIFSGRILKYSFQIPDNIENRIVVIEDNIGNILKDENNTPA